MKKGGQSEERFDIAYFDGINGSVQSTMAKRTELSHAENARSPQIGVLEKRAGQTPHGTDEFGIRFAAEANYGITRFPMNDPEMEGVVRISKRIPSNSNYTVTMRTEVWDQVAVQEPVLLGGPIAGGFEVHPGEVLTNVDVHDDLLVYSTGFNPGVLLEDTINLATDTASTIDFEIFEKIVIGEPDFMLERAEDDFFLHDTDIAESSIYALDKSKRWVSLEDPGARNIEGAQFDYAIAEGNLVLVNGKAENRMILKDGETVQTASTPGSLFNSPNASKVVYYKSRLHLADYSRDDVRYPTSIIRSSYPLGIISLIDGDHADVTDSIQMTDTKYFYSEDGMNKYEIRRGGTLVAEITVTKVNETSVNISPSAAGLLSSDEVWISGTFDGPKQFRWINNPTSTGRDVKQYDTLRLSGGEDDPITLLDTVGNIMLIGNKYSLSTWDDYTLTAMDLNLGCVSLNGSTKLLGTLYFIHYSGIYATTGGVPTLISMKIERYLSGATKAGLENAALGVKGYSVFASIGDVTLYHEDGSVEKVLRDVCLEYSVKDQNWYVHTNVPYQEFCDAYVSTDGQNHTLGLSTAGDKSAMDWLTGNTDDGKEVFFRADLQDLQLIQEFETYAMPTTIIMDSHRGSQIKGYVSLDKGEFYEIDGQFRKGVSMLKINAVDKKKGDPPITRKIKISFRDSSKQICRLNQVAIVYIPTTMETTIE